LLGLDIRSLKGLTEKGEEEVPTWVLDGSSSSPIPSLIYLPTLLVKELFRIFLQTHIGNPR
jgi:hypothetical protein